jgi:hypothetical protein
MEEDSATVVIDNDNTPNTEDSVLYRTKKHVQLHKFPLSVVGAWYQL